MNSKELVKRAIRRENPERLPFWQHLSEKFPDDIADCYEMDRQKGGWFFDNGDSYDDWGCRWSSGGTKNMGQVVEHPLADLNSLKGYCPPNPHDDFYYTRLTKEIGKAGERYVLVTSHFGPFERMHMLRGFSETLMDLYDDPEQLAPIADMVVEHKLAQFKELHRRFGNRVDGIFMTDDWGTQQNAFIGADVFNEFFLPRYQKLTALVHSFGWDFILHSCGRVKSLLPSLISCGFDAFNIQVLEEDIEEIAQLYPKTSFVVMPDYQTIMQSEDKEIISQQVEHIKQSWGSPQGGLIALCFGDLDEISVTEQAAEYMLETFFK